MLAFQWHAHVDHFLMFTWVYDFPKPGSQRPWLVKNIILSVWNIFMFNLSSCNANLRVGPAALRTLAYTWVIFYILPLGIAVTWFFILSSFQLPACFSLREIARMLCQVWRICSQHHASPWWNHGTCSQQASIFVKKFRQLMAKTRLYNYRKHILCYCKADEMTSECSLWLSLQGCSRSDSLIGETRSSVLGKQT